MHPAFHRVAAAEETGGRRLHYPPLGLPVLLTPKAQKLHQQIEQRLDKMEELLTEGISDQELEQFMATVEKLKKNLS